MEGLLANANHSQLCRIMADCPYPNFDLGA
jgi:hypothetical protein